MWISLLCLVACFAGVVRCPPGLLDLLNNDLFAQLSNIHGSKSKCSADLSHTWHSITKEKWAMKMVDSFGKLDAGLLHGRITWTGSYKECLDVLAPSGEDSLGFKGQFCWMHFNVTLQGTQQIPLKIGGCFPNSCDAEEITRSLKELSSFVGVVIGRAGPVVNMVFQKTNLTSISCVRENMTWSTPSIVYMSVFALLTSIVIVATASDFWIKQDPNQECEHEVYSNKTSEVIVDDAETIHSEEVNGSTPLIPWEKQKVKRVTTSCKEILLCFSASKNISAILDVTRRTGQLDSLSGIRFLTMTWIILGHTFTYGAHSVSNPLYMLKSWEAFIYQAIVAAPFSVDTFLFLSGFLLTYVTLKGEALPKNVGGWIYFYAHRYMRLTPAYAMILGLWMTVGDYPASGPFWEQYRPQQSYCTESWWWNFLYINNFQSISNMCIGVSWYLSLDMQLYFVSPLFLVSLKRRPALGLFFATATVLACSLLTYFLSYTNRLKILTRELQLDEEGSLPSETSYIKHFDLLYNKPYTRIGTYLIGMLFAYFILATRNRKQILSKWIVGLGWTIATACALFLVYEPYCTKLGDVGSAFYIAFGKPAWALCLCWLIFACLTGYGGPVNDFLSMKYFLPLSRLSYCAFLIHHLIIKWYLYTLKDVYTYSMITTVMLYLAYLLLTYGLAFVVSVLFEVPFTCLEKELRKRKESILVKYSN